MTMLTFDELPINFISELNLKLNSLKCTRNCNLISFGSILNFRSYDKLYHTIPMYTRMSKIFDNYISLKQCTLTLLTHKILWDESI